MARHDLSPDETLLDILRSLSPPPSLLSGLPLLDGAAGLPLHAVVELAGGSGCGKSAVLYHLVARVLAASECGGGGGGASGGGWRAGGPPQRVALFDLDGRFSAPAFARTVAGCLRGGGGVGGAPLPARVRACLSRVDVFSPGGLAPLVDALGALAASAHPPVLLALDGVSLSWHWHCRVFSSQRERERLEAGVADALRKLQGRSGGACRVVWTRPCVYGGGGGGGGARAPSAGTAAGALAVEAAAAVRRAGGLPALAAAPPAPAEHGAPAPADTTLTQPLAGLVTHRLALTRLRAAPAPPITRPPPPAAAAASRAACATAVVVAGGGAGAASGAPPTAHPGDPAAALGGGAGGAEGELRVALVAARMAAEGGGAVEMLLALAA
jgi:RecA/RadA recombinase